MPVSCHTMVSARVTADLDTMTILHTHTLRTHPKNVPLVSVAVTCAIHSTYTIVFFYSPSLPILIDVRFARYFKSQATYANPKNSHTGVKSDG
eukprot:COSAG01_NODE_4747_length_4768_cov_180.128721_2_plen_93_part_00